MAQVASNTLQKPEAFISISYRHNEHLSFAGTFDPAFLLNVVRMAYTVWINDAHNIPFY
jgi:phenylpyruvate tautomerase